MVRTKADRVPTKAVGGKAPAKALKTAGTATPKKVIKSGKGKSYAGGNPYHPRDTPEWQKPITCFINQNSSKDAGDSLEAQDNEEQKVKEESEAESD